MYIQLSWRSAVAVSAALVSLFSLGMPLMVLAQAAPNPYATLDPHVSADVEARIRQYFADVPVMANIAKCESGFRQYGSDGLPLFDPSYSMIGAFQVSAAHLPEALTMGMDVTTLEGNMAYARYLYNAGGTDPWLDSFQCWGGMPLGTVLGTTTDPIVRAPSAISLRLGVTSQTVLQVQQMLNKIGFTVSLSGPGSAGQETTMFGSLTRAAVRSFQCAKSIACQGDESTTGYGLVNDATYQALLAAANSTASTPPSAPATPAPSDKTAQISALRSQITILQNQIDAINSQITQLSQ
jgi:hypothetical protein